MQEGLFFEPKAMPDGQVDALFGEAQSVNENCQSFVRICSVDCLPMRLIEKL
jgi:hypothetical protein